MARTSLYAKRCVLIVMTNELQDMNEDMFLAYIFRLNLQISCKV